MAGGGYVQLPDGSMVVAVSLRAPAPSAPSAHGGGPGAQRRAPTALRRPRPPAAPPRPRWSAHADEARTVRAARPGLAGAPQPGEEHAVRVLVHARNRPRALTRLRNLGLRAVYLSGNAEPPTEDEVSAVLHHPDGMVWRPSPCEGAPGGAPWQPIATLLRPRTGHAPTTLS